MNLFLILLSLFSAKWNCIEKQYFDWSGRPLSGGKIYFYYAGTNAPVSVYHDGGVTPMTNPVILDASGHTKMCGDMDRAYTVNIMDGNDVLTWQTGFAGPSYYFAGTVSYDTVYISSKTDTLVLHDTLTVFDTITVIKRDTVQKITYGDTLKIHDTLERISLAFVYDTINVTKIDTVIKKILDTIRITDTIEKIKHDTLNGCVEGRFINYFEKLYTAKGQSTQNSAITIEPSSGNSPSIEVETNADVNVEVYIYDNLGVAVASGVYTVKASTTKQYITFNGYSKNGSRVPNGVYLMRVVSEHNNMISNNVYRVGINNRVAE